MHLTALTFSRTVPNTFSLPPLCYHYLCGLYGRVMVPGRTRWSEDFLSYSLISPGPPDMIIIQIFLIKSSFLQNPINDRDISPIRLITIFLNRSGAHRVPLLNCSRHSLSTTTKYFFFLLFGFTSAFPSLSLVWQFVSWEFVRLGGGCCFFLCLMMSWPARSFSLYSSSSLLFLQRVLPADCVNEGDYKMLASL